MVADKFLSLYTRLASWFVEKPEINRREINRSDIVEHGGGENWEELTVDILEKILSHLDAKSIALVKSVCKSWLALFNEPGLRTPRKNPWLLLPHSQSFTSLKFYDMFSPHNSIYSINVPERIRGGQVCGSSKGWLAVVRSQVFFLYDHIIEFYLFDPLSGELHKLPQLPLPRDFDYCADDCQVGAALCVDQVELSSKDLSECVVAVTLDYGLVLACCRPEDERWTTLKDTSMLWRGTYMSFCDETLYVITNRETTPVLESGFQVATESLTMKLYGGGGTDGDDPDHDDVCCVELKLLPRFTEEGLVPVQYYANIRIEGEWFWDYLRESSKKDGVIYLVRKYMKIYGFEDDVIDDNYAIEDGHDHEHHDDDQVLGQEFEGDEAQEVEVEAEAEFEGDEAQEVEAEAEVEAEVEGRDVDEEICGNKIHSFSVFKLTPCRYGGDTAATTTSESYSAKRVESLDDIHDDVFVGLGSIFMHSFDSNMSMKGGNHIYYTDDIVGEGAVSRETGVYHIGEGKHRQCLPSIDLPGHSCMYWF